MSDPPLHVVTGAFGYSGRYIARRLLDAGFGVRTLTGSPNRRHPFGERVEVRPLRLEDHAQLVESLRGATVLHNTYWVRFNHRDFRFADAVDNTLALFDAAREAGIGRVVHVSITNPSEDSPLEYFRGKARLERALRESGLSYAILRPAVLFGGDDILINNIAWALRRLPVFGVFGDGRYRIQPIHVDDLARLAVAEAMTDGDRTVDAIGPETLTYRDLVRQIGATIGKPRPVVSVPPPLGYLVTSVAGVIVRDVIVTRDEIRGLMADLLHTNSPPAGTTRLTDWMQEHRDGLGRRYASELARRRNRVDAYSAIDGRSS
ncbi:MAG: SDR family oxidoreductase [Planctomycetota bacterium]|jgi:NADH dehydrogenase